MDERSSEIVAEPIGARGRLFESDHPDKNRRIPACRDDGGFSVNPSFTGQSRPPGFFCINTV